MNAKLTYLQVQKTILAPIMQQSIEVLLMPITDLDAAIDQELEKNPLLEVDEEKNKIEKSKADELMSQDIKQLLELTKYQYNNSYNYNQDDEKMENAPIANSEPLEFYLLQQLRLEFNDPLKIKIGEAIIGNLDEDGYLTTTLEEIAHTLNIENIDIIEKVLEAIKNFDPIGIGSRNIKECLLTQIKFRFNGNSTLLSKIIEDHLVDLGRKKHIEIARKLKISPEDVKYAANVISRLEPKPARKFRPIEDNIYIKPDVTIKKTSDDEYSVEINKQSLPYLKISSTYQNMLNQPNRTKEEIDFINEKIKNAILFIRSIDQRHSTIKRISDYIVENQKEFLDEGHMALKPMVLKDVAEAIDRNESTISRAINNKYIDTPQGLLPMKFFFSQAISENGNRPVSNRSIKEEMKMLIDHEDKQKPLSDQEIQNYFKEKGMQIARRTINKYRKILNILPSHLRKE